MTTKAKRILCSMILIVTFLTTTASSCTSDPTCDVTGPNTALTTCAYNVVKGN